MSQQSSRSGTTHGEGSARLARGPGGAAPAVDPDIDLHQPSQRREWSRRRFVLPVIALGGMLGASGRYAATLTWPTSTERLPWTTLGVNALGCLLIGVLMVFVVEIGGAHPLLRPFVGVGILGGFTTFSTYAVDTGTLLQAGRPGLALAYWAGTLAIALLAVTTGVLLTRASARIATWVRRRRTSPPQHLESRTTDTERGRS